MAALLDSLLLRSKSLQLLLKSLKVSFQLSKLIKLQKQPQGFVPQRNNPQKAVMNSVMGSVAPKVCTDSCKSCTCNYSSMLGSNCYSQTAH